MNVARLGTGDASAPFSDAFIQLPGPASRSQSDLVPTDNPGGFRAAACPAQQNGPSPLPYPNSTFPIRQTHGCSDINGDGIRDYVARCKWRLDGGIGNGRRLCRAENDRE